MKHRLPFKVGQEAEARSFITGFRGAWFRCKVGGENLYYCYLHLKDMCALKYTMKFICVCALLFMRNVGLHSKVNICMLVILAIFIN